MRRQVGGLALAILVGALAGCGAQAPDGVTARVYQTRSDVAASAFEIQVHNGSPTDVTVTRAVLRSSHLSEPAVYDRSTRIPAGATVDLKVALPPVACADPTTATDEAATVDLALSAGSQSSQVTLAAPDSLGQLARIAEVGCFAQRVSQVVTFEPPGSPLRSGDVLTLLFRVVPTGTPGSVRLVRTGPTTLLTPADGSGRASPAQRVGLTVSQASAPGLIRLRYRPARCDAHALAEDKQGTLLPLRVATAGSRGQVTLPVDASLRSLIQREVGRICGLE